MHAGTPRPAEDGHPTEAACFAFAERDAPSPGEGAGRPEQPARALAVVPASERSPLPGRSHAEDEGEVEGGQVPEHLLLDEVSVAVDRLEYLGEGCLVGRVGVGAAGRCGLTFSFVHRVQDAATSA
jgi:hypothetical protein